MSNFSDYLTDNLKFPLISGRALFYVFYVFCFCVNKLFRKKVRFNCFEVLRY